jgi:hypothetical protein
MIAFTLNLPDLTEEQRLGLEEVLLKIPRVDAFALEDTSGDFSVTADADNKVLRDLVAALYGWASDYPGLLMALKATCSGGSEMLVGTHSPNDVIHFLSTC